MSVSAPRLPRLCDIGFRIPLVPEAVIVDCLRTACGKAPTGTLRNVWPDEPGAAFMRALLEKYPQVKKEDVEDVIIGCAMPEGEAGLNMARAITLRSGLPVTTPAMTINRFCSSGLQAIVMASHTSNSVLVYPLARLRHASFGSRLATTPLRFAITSPPSGCEKNFTFELSNLLGKQ